MPFLQRRHCTANQRPDLDFWGGTLRTTETRGEETEILARKSRTPAHFAAALKKRDERGNFARWFVNASAGNEDVTINPSVSSLGPERVERAGWIAASLRFYS